MSDVPVTGPRLGRKFHTDLDSASRLAIAVLYVAVCSCEGIAVFKS